MSEFSERLLEKYGKRLPAEYVNAIASMAEGRINRRFLNDSPEHASLLIECMIGRAEPNDMVRIYAGRLRPDCYQETLALLKEHKLRVLVDDYDSAKKTIEGIEGGTSIDVRKCTEGESNHFFTVGDSFRFELDDGKATAVGNFNEPEIVAKLNARFDTMWDQAGHGDTRNL